MTGFIKLHRSIMKWEWRDEPLMFAMWVGVLFMANYEDKKWRGVTIKRGQFISTPEKIGAACGLSRQQVRTRLAFLVKTGEITSESTNSYTLYTIANYSKYQDKQPADNQQANQRITNEQPTDNQRITTTKELKELEELEEKKENTPAKPKMFKPSENADRMTCGELFDMFWNIYPDYGGDGARGAAFKGDKQKAKSSFEKILKEKGEDYDYGEIISKCKQYGDFCGATTTTVCHAATWLNQRRWENDYSYSTAPDSTLRGGNSGGKGAGGLHQVQSAAEKAKAMLGASIQAGRA